MRIASMVVGIVLAALAAGCTSPEEQHAEDQQRCFGYGFQPGTDAFAHCMMATSLHREDQQAAYQRDQAFKAQQNAALAAQAQRKDLPACRLGDPGVTLTINGWAGPGCAGVH
jgi:hypothetical protein